MKPLMLGEIVDKSAVTTRKNAMPTSNSNKDGINFMPATHTEPRSMTGHSPNALAQPGSGIKRAVISQAVGLV